jgi:hypothetical protein
MPFRDQLRKTATGVLPLGGGHASRDQRLARPMLFLGDRRNRGNENLGKAGRRGNAKEKEEGKYRARHPTRDETRLARETRKTLQTLNPIHLAKITRGPVGCLRIRFQSAGVKNPFG